MGAKSSTSSSSSSSSTTSGVSGDYFNCDFCGGSAKDGRRDESGQSCCSRCGALLRPINTKKSAKKKTETKEYSGVDEKEEVSLPLKRIHLVPYRETLPEDAKSDLAENVMVDNFLKPFFASGKHNVQIGQRFQINEIDFKVVAAHPPSGYVTESTQIRCMDQPLSALAHVQKLHVLPSAASITAILGSEAKLDHAQLFSEYVKPYFASQSRHVTQGDTFMSKGIQFKVIGAAPTNGTVDRATEIYTDGGWLPDLKKVHILPIFESLPNREKTITPTQTFERYLEPYFAGRHQLIHTNEELQIDGVSFKVIAAEPADGLVTVATVMFADGEPVRMEDIKHQQLEADEELARQLQRQEANAGGYVPRGLMPGMGGMGMGMPGMGGPPSGGVPVPDELRARLQDILRVMPAHDRNRPLVQRLHDQLAMLPFVPAGTPYDRNLLVLLQAVNSMSAGGAGGPPPNNGASQRDIESLPTRKYVAVKTTTPATETKEQDKEHISCIVCMGDYEAGEELRTLPCFHSYHKECIDKWLSDNKKCPICKNPIC